MKYRLYSKYVVNRVAYNKKLKLDYPHSYIKLFDPLMCEIPLKW